MTKSRFTEAQSIGMIKKQKAGMPTTEIRREHGLSPASFCKLKARFGGMDLSDDRHWNAIHTINGAPWSSTMTVTAKISP